MYKIIEIVNRKILINVNDIAYVSVVDNKIAFYMNNTFTITATCNNATKLYKTIKEFILDSEANIMQIE